MCNAMGRMQTGLVPLLSLWPIRVKEAKKCAASGPTSVNRITRIGASLSLKLTFLSLATASGTKGEKRESVMKVKCSQHNSYHSVNSDVFKQICCHPHTFLYPSSIKTIIYSSSLLIHLKHHQVQFLV